MSESATQSENHETSTANTDAPRRRSLLFLLPLACFGGVVALALWGLGFTFSEGSERRNPSEIPSVMIGRPVPDFALDPVPGLKTPEGQVIPGLSSQDLKGRVTLVNVWASWCTSCRDEHQSLLALSKDPSVRLVGLNYKDKPADALRMLARSGNPYQAVGMDEKGRVGIDWGVYGVPETFIVDAEGRIRGKHIGPIYPQQLEEFRRKVKAAESPAGGA